MRLLLTLLLTLTTTVTLASSQGLDSEAEIHRNTDTFMAEVSNSKITAAYQHLRPYLGVDAEPYDQSASEATEYFKRVIDRVGQPLGYAHVETETIGEDFYRETWLQKFGAAAIAWTFTFYRPVDNWKVVGVSYTTDIEPLYRKLD